MKIGCQVSIADSIAEAPKRAYDLGCETFQIFSRSPQGGKATDLTSKLKEKFKLNLAKYKISDFVIHTPFYINFASTNNRIRYGSSGVVRDELERGSLLGARYVMTHLGSAKELGLKEALKQTAEMLQKSLDGYTGSTKLLIENSAGAGEIIGDDLSEIAKIIKLTGNKNIAGICLDTQHSFASGYDWNDFDKTLEKIDKEIGLKNIKLLHVNDSVSDLGSHIDRHAHIGQGKIGLENFQKIVAFAQKNNIDMICETEHEGVKEDMKILKKFRK